MAVSLFAALRRVTRASWLPRLACAGLIAATLAGCATAQRTVYTAEDAKDARILGLDTLRRYGDEPLSAFQNEVRPTFPGPQTYLALSGGGADGAYGAGALNGWTDSGRRPVFTIVSGVSTGALIAPFAFLGSAYDATLREVYTSGVAATLLSDTNVLNVFFGSGFSGNLKLRELVARYLSDDMIAQIADSYRQGRALYVVTTNVDSQRSVIWDMGKIASLGTPESRNLFRDVLAASASIPAVFSPMLLTAEANGRSFSEMHVDGGVTAPVLTLPQGVLTRGANLSGGSRLALYVLMNNKINNEFQVVPDRTLDVASRSLSTILKTQTRAILQLTYQFAQRNKMPFNLSYIESSVPSPATPAFDTPYMRALYDYGYERARAGTLWVSKPPADAEPVQTRRIPVAGGIQPLTAGMATSVSTQALTQ